MMREVKRRKLNAKGWKVGDAKDFLGLSPLEDLVVDLRMALADALRNRRLRDEMTQAQVAGVLGSSQSRVAKMEAADSAVSLDLLVRALLALGATRKDLARIVAGGR